MSEADEFGPGGMFESGPNVVAAEPPVLGHKPESVQFNGETWQIICDCAWETWGVEDDEEAWEAFNDHVFDDVNTALVRLRKAARITDLTQAAPQPPASEPQS